MAIYRILFKYGNWNLWAEIECAKLKITDNLGFIDLAHNAVRTALKTLTQIEDGHVAHDILILELNPNENGINTYEVIFAKETLDYD